MTQVQWPGASFTLDNRCIVHQGRKERAIQRGRHGQQPEIGAKRLLRLKRQSQAKIAIKAALMNLLEEAGGYAGQFRIVLHTDERGVGKEGDSTCRTRLSPYN